MEVVIFWLSYPDSNQEMRHQKPLCYHYTIGQSGKIATHRHNCGAKLGKKIAPCKSCGAIFCKLAIFSES